MAVTLTLKETADVTKSECNFCANYHFVTALCQYFSIFLIFLQNHETYNRFAAS